MKQTAAAATIYADIIDRPYKPSAVHPHMPSATRAAQFAPFAALHGHGESIDEAARYVDSDIYLSDNSVSDIARRIAEAYDAAIEVVIKHFRADRVKQGGAVLIARGTIVKINQAEGYIRLSDGTTIQFADIRDIHSDTIDL